MRNSNTELLKEVAALRSENIVLNANMSGLLKSLNLPKAAQKLGDAPSSPKRRKKTSTVTMSTVDSVVQPSDADKFPPIVNKRPSQPTYASFFCQSAPTTPANVPISNSTSDLPWIPVSKKMNNRDHKEPEVPKTRRPIIVGSNSDSNSNLALNVIDKKKWLHISSFKNTVSSDDIIMFIEKQLSIPKEQLSCFPLIKKDANISELKFVNFK